MPNEQWTGPVPLSNITSYDGLQFGKSGDPWYDVKAFGAKGDGIADDTAAFANAWAAAAKRVGSTGYLLATGVLYVPPGTYNLVTLTGLEGPDAAPFAFAIMGAGREVSKIVLPAGVYLIDTAQIVTAMLIRNLQVSGGAGCFRSRLTGTNVFLPAVIDDNSFVGYTGAAININASDWPYWRIRRNTFDGTSTSSMGIALGGDITAADIRENGFLRNRYHIKVRGPNLASFYMRENDFIRSDAYVATPRTDIWIVPPTSGQSNFGSNNAGVGVVIAENKFGSENWSANDYKILFADENTGSGTDNGSRSHSSAASSGYLTGIHVTRNRFSYTGGTGTQLVYSTTDLLRSIRVDDNEIDGDRIPYLLQFLTGTPTDRFQTTGVFRNNRALAPGQGVISLPTSVSNAVAMVGTLEDPSGLMSSHSQQTSHLPGMSDGVEYVQLMTVQAPLFALNGNIIVGITDALGGGNAGTATLAANTYVNGNVTNAVIAGKPVFIEIDLRSGGATPLAEVRIRLQDFSNNILFERSIAPPAAWRRFRFTFTPGIAGTSYGLLVMNPSGSSGTVQFGRPTIYHAREPFTPLLWRSVAALTDGSVVNVDAYSGSYFTLSAAAGRTIAAPTNAASGLTRTFDILNNSGGAMITTWNAVFKLAGAWVDPASTKRRKITFTFDGTNWIEDSRTTADI